MAGKRKKVEDLYSIFSKKETEVIENPFAKWERFKELADLSEREFLDLLEYADSLGKPITPFRIARYLAQGYFVPVLITGRMRAGKTWGGLSLGEIFDPTFTAETLPERFFFRLAPFLERFWDVQGHALILDEAERDIDKRYWSSQIIRAFDLAIQSQAITNLLTIIILPSPSWFTDYQLGYFFYQLVANPIGGQRGIFRVYRIRQSPVTGRVHRAFVEFWKIPPPSVEIQKVFYKLEEQNKREIHEEIKAMTRHYELKRKLEHLELERKIRDLEMLQKEDEELRSLTQALLQEFRDYLAE